MNPIQGRLSAATQRNGDNMAEAVQRPEAIERGARMLRTALGPAIAGFLEDPMSGTSRGRGHERDTERHRRRHP